MVVIPKKTKLRKGRSMKRMLLIGAALTALAACDTPVPDSAAGVGFQNYDEFEEQQRARDAALAGRQTVTGASSITEIPLDGTGTPITTSDAPLQASPDNPAPTVATSATGISQENDFGAVSDQRTIQDDAALIAQNRAQYTVIQPTDLPSRSGDEGPNIVAYALQTTNPVGAPIYTRGGFFAEARFQRNCAAYVTSDQAQSEFLARGGPQRDRLGLDPDGDGFACDWDPTPFRVVRQGN